EGLIKILFATETFSIGLNMPARTVVFTNTRKFDGQDFRWITSGEYIQMSGRAGRRGKDDRGIVIQMLDEKMDPQVAKGMLYGEADALNSSYHISYNMLLNMLRVEDADPDFLVKSSFHQFQQEASAPALEDEASNLDGEKALLAAGLKDEERTSEYFLVLQQLERTRGDVRRVIQRPENCLPYIQTGRLLRMRGWPVGHGDQGNKPQASGVDGQKGDLQSGHENSGELDWGWGAIVDLQRKPASKAGDPAKFEVAVLVMCKPEDGKRGKEYLPPAPMKDGEMRVLHFTLGSMVELSSVRLLMPPDLRAAERRAAVAESMKEAVRRLQDPSLEKLLARETQLQLRLDGLPFHDDQDREEQLQRFTAMQHLADKAKLLRKEAKGVQHMVMKDEMRRRKRVLRRLGHCDSDGVIQLKGRVACEINTCDELVVTELIFSGAFTELTPEQSAAVLSCMVHQVSL
ncbi:unnamed protein product, partial [Hapterophycus canaliculatus]